MNMSYCCFQNTLSALQDCYAHLDDKKLSGEEESARRRLIELCKNIALDTTEDEETDSGIMDYDSV